MPRGNYGRANAQKQRRTFVPKQAPTRPRTSWWTQFGQQDFTAIAKVMVQPDSRVVYRFPGAE